MKPIYVVLAVLALVVLVTMGTNQVYAPRNCGSCVDFKKLTTQFEKDVIDAVSQQPPGPEKIQTLFDEYICNVLDLFPSSSSSHIHPFLFFY